MIQTAVLCAAVATLLGPVHSFHCPKQDGKYPNPKDCTAFYECTKGQVIKRHCSAGQVFQHNTLSCVSSSLAPPCHNSSRDSNFVEEPEGLFHCPHDGYFRDSSHCDIYYICASGNSMRMTCDPGTSFDLTFNLCLWSSEVHDCNDTSPHLSEEIHDKVLLPEKSSMDAQRMTTSRNEFKKEYQCPEENGVFPDLQNCSVYYTCTNGLARLNHCPHGLGYDVMIGTCLESFHASSCVSDDRLYDTGLEVQTSFICPEAHGLYPDPDNCSFFIHCFKKVAYRHQCQPDTVFSSVTAACTWRELVPECQAHKEVKNRPDDEVKVVDVSKQEQGQRRVEMEPYQPYLTLGESSEKPTELQDFTCPDVVDGFFRDNLFCDIFHRCVLGQRFTFTCPTGTFFRLHGNLCDYWETVSDCTQDGLRREFVKNLPEIAPQIEVKPVPKDIELNIVGIDADPIPCPEASGLFAHPRNCHQFLFCAHSIPLVLTCPESLLYNTQTLTCDLAKNVQCIRYDDYGKI